MLLDVTPYATVFVAAERRSRDGSWSVFTSAGVPFAESVRSCRNNQPFIRPNPPFAAFR